MPPAHHAKLLPFTKEPPHFSNADLLHPHPAPRFPQDPPLQDRDERPKESQKAAAGNARSSASPSTYHVRVLSYFGNQLCSCDIISGRKTERLKVRQRAPRFFFSGPARPRKVGASSPRRLLFPRGLPKKLGSFIPRNLVQVGCCLTLHSSKLSNCFLLQRRTKKPFHETAAGLQCSKSNLSW